MHFRTDSSSGFCGCWALAVFLEVGPGKSISIRAWTWPVALEVDGAGLAGFLLARLGSPHSASGWSSSKRTFLTVGATGAGEGDLEDCSDGLRSAFLLWRCGGRALRREEVEDSEVSLSELVDTYSFNLNC